MPKLSELFGKPLLAGAACAVVAFFSYSFISAFIPSKLAVVGAIALAGITYVVLLFLVRGISGDEIKLLPKGEKIYRILRKFKFVK